jgi:anti-anti-sigma regulatory factor
MHFHVSTSRFTYGDVTVIKVEGQFDLASVNSVAAPAEESILTRRPIAFDLSGCTFIDSSAMRFLVQAARLPDVPTAVVVGRSPIRAALAVMPMNEGIPVFPVLDEALDWLHDCRKGLADGRRSPVTRDEQREAIEAEMRPDPQ